MSDQASTVPPAIWGALAFSAAIWLVSALFGIVVAVQARRRGYRFSVWVVVGILANPVYLLILLATMPDFARKRLRAKFRAELDAKLACRSPQARPPVPVSSTAGTFTASPELSVGDRMTVLPRDRSLGDEETRA
jgi:hypothetical protein